MNGISKLLFALKDSSPAAQAAFVAWARDVSAGERVARAEIESLAPDAHAAHTPKVARWSAFASLWVVGDRADLLRSAPDTADWFLVRDRLAFDRSARPDEARPWAGVKKTTLWTPIDGVDKALWQARYTNHGVLTGAYHATAVRYQQNVVIEGTVPGIGAVSELWWTNVDDLIHRFYASPEAQQLIGFDVLGFVDASRAYPVVTTHEVLRVSDVIGSQAFLPE